MLALELIFLSLIGLWMGAQLSLYLEKAEKQTYEASKMKDASKTKYGKQAALIVFIASYLCEVVVIIEKVMFIISHSYVSYYVDFKSSLPYIIYVGSTFMFFSLCIWLAFLPSKKEAYIDVYKRQSTYYCRDTFKSLCEMAFQNGKWNVITNKYVPGSMGIRHFVPLAFLSSLIGLCLGSFWSKTIRKMLIGCLLYTSYPVSPKSMDKCSTNGGIIKWQDIENSEELPVREKRC